MKGIVIYISRYGSARLIAERIGQLLACPVVPFCEVEPSTLAQYDTIILGTCLLEGTIKESPIIEAWYDLYHQKQWILFTVGFAVPNLEELTRVFQANFTNPAIKSLPIFSFSCTIGYKRLEFMQSLLSRLTQDNPQGSFDNMKLTQSELALLEHYGTTYDMAQEKRIEDLVFEVERHYLLKHSLQSTEG